MGIYGSPQTHPKLREDFSKCPKCKRQLEYGFKLCPYCGHELVQMPRKKTKVPALVVTVVLLVAAFFYLQGGTPAGNESDYIKGSAWVAEAQSRTALTPEQTADYKKSAVAIDYGVLSESPDTYTGKAVKATIYVTQLPWDDAEYESYIGYARYDMLGWYDGWLVLFESEKPINMGDTITFYGEFKDLIELEDGAGEKVPLLVLSALCRD